MIERMPGALSEDLRKSSARVCAHMNKDHPASVLAYAHWFARRPRARNAILVEITPEGFLIDIFDGGDGGGARTRALVPYSEPLTSAGAIRKIAVKMHFEAFRELGFVYKIRHGYFQDAARQAVSHMPSRVIVPAALLPFLLLFALLSTDMIVSLPVVPLLTAAFCLVCDYVFEPRFLAALQKKYDIKPFSNRPFSLKQIFHTTIIAF